MSHTIIKFYDSSTDGALKFDNKPMSLEKLIVKSLMLRILQWISVL
jgi:hypothetical protein